MDENILQRLESVALTEGEDGCLNLEEPDVTEGIQEAE